MREALKLSIEVLENFYSYGFDREMCEKAIISAKEALGHPEPAKVSALDFVEMIYDKEHLVGRPIMWAEWPNREKTE